MRRSDSEIWEQLSTILKEFTQSVDTDALVAQIDEPLTGRSCLAWEVGPDPYDPKVWALCFRVPGSVKCRKEVLAFFSKRPTLPGWKLYYGLPPKNWRLHLEVLGKDGRSHPVEGSTWDYVASEQGGKWYLMLYPPEGIALPEELTSAIAGILVESEVGEANCDRYISEVKISKTRSANAQPLPNLARDFVRSFPQCEWADLLTKKSCGSYDY